MKKIVLLLIIVTLCFSAKAEQIDTCKIKVERTDKGFKISAASENVFVRQGNSLDPKNYVFLTDTLVEILCKDSIGIKLQDCHQEGKVTCWSQKSGEDAKQDKSPTHQLAPAERRNWLKFNSMNASTQVEMVIISDNSQSANIDFRKCGGWSIDQVGVKFEVKKDKGDSYIDLQWQNESNMFSTIELKDGVKIDKLTLYKKKPRTMQVNKVLLDNKTSVPYMISTNQSDSIQADDIMLNSEISVDLSDVELSSGGSHKLFFVCSVLKNQGPEDVSIIIPIEVKEEGNWLAWIMWGLISFFGLIVLLFCSIIILKKIRKSKKKYNNVKSSEDQTEHKNKEGKSPIQGTDSGSDKNQAKVDTPIKSDSDAKKEQEKESSQIVPSDDVLKEIRKKTIRTIIEEWNANHPENIVDNSHFNINSFMNIIAKGYISPKGKAMLEKYADAYQIQDEELGAKSIEGLHTAIYNRGLLDGAASTKTTKGDSDQMSEILNKQIGELSEQKTKLEKIVSDLKKDNASIQGEKNKLQDHVNAIDKENERLYNACEDQSKKIAELQQLVDAQSQEHVSLLEENIKELKKEIATAQDTISKKADAIADEKENVKKLTIQKENLNNKYKTLKDEYDKIDGKHQGEITKLKEAHKEASIRQKEKYEAQLKDKDEEIVKKQTAHETALKDQKDQYEAKLTQQQEESKAALKKKEEEYQKALEKLKKDQEAKVAKLNATIKELGASANAGRDQAIEDAEKLLKTIASDLGNIENSVKTVVSQSPIFVNSINNIFSELQRTQEEFDDYKTEDWSKPEMLQAQVIADMQDIFIKALNRSGWMNNVARLLSYSRLPKLHDGTPDGIDLPSKLEAHGISAAVLERIYSNMVNLLGIANMGILVPAVLANNYDKESYEYKNDDTWIDKFFPEVSTRNYKGKVFDIVQVGYTVEGVTEKKPVVQYN